MSGRTDYLRLLKSLHFNAVKTLVHKVLMQVKLEQHLLSILVDVVLDFKLNIICISDGVVIVYIIQSRLSQLELCIHNAFC